MASETRPYEARKTEGSESWEIYNVNLKAVVDSNLSEEVAKSRAELANEMYEKASTESDDA